MDGFKRPSRRTEPVQPQQPEAGRPLGVAVGQSVRPPQPPTPTAQRPAVSNQTNTLSAEPSTTTSTQPALAVPKRRRWLFIFGGCLVVGLLIIIACVVWYKHALTPVNPRDKTVQQVQIGEGASFSFVSDRLEERRLIRSSLAFTIYAQLHGKRADIKKGTCNLSPSESTGDILKKLTDGCNDFRTVTFYPGATVMAPKGSTSGKDFSAFAGLKAAGFSDEAIHRALEAQYKGPLFADKPTTMGLEGYIYGDTYYINVDGGPEQALNYAFSEMQKVVKDNDLVAKFKKLGLNLYQGITMASIIQRELSCDNIDVSKKDICYANQQKIAQVFYTRLADNMTLGSDPTYIYAAGLTGEAATTQLDSPYNTRINTGLPPGPIATPGKLALIAAANPASTDYLYFVAGNEGGGAVYFAKDEAGHQYNITHHCQELCG